MARRVYRRSRVIKAEHEVTGTRLCLCGHVFHWHWRGWCGVCRRLEMPECPTFAKDVRVPRLVYGLPYLASAEVFDPHRHYIRRLA